jgi:cytoskeletal protein CcmA (bactofilin family)
MFNKQVTGKEGLKTDGNGTKESTEKDMLRDTGEKDGAKLSAADVNKSKTNAILKGSKLTGDISVTSDLELSGDVEGNIKSEQDSNIIIRGTCKGNIETRGGSVDIEGVLKQGNIVAGSNVNISGKFRGGAIKAEGRIYVNGEFDGTLEGNEVEIGSNAQGSGEILYGEHVSISRGAKVEIQISRIQETLKTAKNAPHKKVIDLKLNAKEKKDA